MFKNTGVFTMACDTWHVCPTANQTLIEFCMHFTSENKEHLCKLTSSQVGFHSANAAISKATKPTNIASSLPVPLAVLIPPAPPTTAAIVTNNKLHMYYCWTHGLGFNHNHMSTTCSKPAKATTLLPQSRTCMEATTPSCQTIATPNRNEDGGSRQQQHNHLN